MAKKSTFEGLRLDAHSETSWAVTGSYDSAFESSHQALHDNVDIFHAVTL